MQAQRRLTFLTAEESLRRREAEERDTEEGEEDMSND